MLIARLLNLFCILGFVVALQDLQNSTSTVTTSTSAAKYCQLSGGYCRMHMDCCSRRCMQVPAECR
ncbi:uncharacterized protein LOC119559266 [Drosophila subpulchrella]|uniref:uncharacterized protein LOC119559266 n=1 Tax=Drosophila subpulchrella TaxID=1486046 RepID=UPI0018A19468|nr:uncharacterized protein LOC119559266 [Drosophila subpulchrella]